MRMNCKDLVKRELKKESRGIHLDEFLIIYNTVTAFKVNSLIENIRVRGPD